MTQHHFEFFDPDDDSDDAPVNDYPDVFRAIADVLHESGHHAQAVRFFEPLLRVQRNSDIHVMMRMAQSYHLLGALDRAVGIYQNAVKVKPHNTDVRIELARVYEQMGETAKAFEHVAAVIKMGREDIVKKAKLAMHKPRDPSPARPIVEEAAAEEDEGDEEDGLFVPSTVKPQKPPRSRKAADKRTSTKPVNIAPKRTEPDRVYTLETMYARLQALTADMRADDEEPLMEWISVAQHLVDAFKQAKVFFPTETYVPFLGYTAEAKRRAVKSRTGLQRTEMELMADRLKNSLGDQPDMDTDELEDVHLSMTTVPLDYRNILFTSWFEVFLELAFVYARRDNLEACYSVLTTASEANVFHHDTDRLFRIHVCWFASALLLSDEERLCNEARWFIKSTNYATDTFRLFAALNRCHAGPTSWYNSGPLQKFFLRTIKALDYALLGDTQRPRYKWSEQEKQAYLNAVKAGTPDSPAYPATHDPFLLLMYGHMLATAGSYLNALNYYFRAYAAQPTHPLTVFSIGLAYLQHALKRQCDNRHAYALQGVAFVKEYKRLRMQEELGGVALRNREMEVEFNEARVWHLLGLLHLAVPGYERVLGIAAASAGGLGLRHAQDEDWEMVDRDNDAAQAPAEGMLEEPGFQREAAYALQGIFAVSGDVEKAREVTERWLVF